MKIKFIGTSSGQTTLKRFHSSFLIQENNYNLLVDAGDGISKALLSSCVDLNTVSSLLFTHMHPDHSAGFPSLLVQLKLLKRTGKLTVFCYEYHKDNLLALLKNMHIFPDRLGYQLEFITFISDHIVDTGSGIKFKAVENSHLAGLRSIYPGDKSIVSFGIIFYLQDKKIFYTSDAAGASDLYGFGNEKIDILISEITHITYDEIIKGFRLSGASDLYLTHIMDDNEFLQKDDRVYFVNDGYEISL